MKRLIVVHGTYGRAEGWHQIGTSLLSKMAAARGILLFDFHWSGGLFGVPTSLPGDPELARYGADDGKLLPWCDAGEKLGLAVGALGYPAISVLSHSHGLQVVAFAAATAGIQFDTAISVSGPVRRDMLRARRAAMARIGKWFQFVDPTYDDKVIVAGEWSDGEFSRAEFALPEGTTIYTPGTGHSGALTDATYLAQMLDLLNT